MSLEARHGACKGLFAGHVLTADIGEHSGCLLLPVGVCLGGCAQDRSRGVCYAPARLVGERHRAETTAVCVPGEHILQRLISGVVHGCFEVRRDFARRHAGQSIRRGVSLTAQTAEERRICLGLLCRAQKVGVGALARHRLHAGRIDPLADHIAHAAGVGGAAHLPL